MSTKTDTKVEEVIQDPNTQESDTPEDSKKEEKKEDLLTPEKVNKIVQDRLAKEQKKFEERLVEEKKEAERLAQLSEQEKQKELEAKRNKEVTEREKTLAVRENTLTAREKLRDAGVSEDMAEFLVTPNSDETTEKVEQFIEKHNSSVSNAVQNKLKGTPPKEVSSSSQQSDREVITAF